MIPPIPPETPVGFRKRATSWEKASGGMRRSIPPEPDPIPPSDDAPRLLQMLQASWGQSRVLELALADYAAAYCPAAGTADMSAEVGHTSPHRTAPYHTTPYHTTPHHTTPHRTTPRHQPQGRKAALFSSSSSPSCLVSRSSSSPPVPLLVLYRP